MALIGRWDLQDNAASTVVVGTVGGNGTAARNTSLTSTTGPGGNLPLAWLGNGSSDKITLSAGTLLKNVSTWTEMGWVKYTSTAQGFVLFISDGSSGTTSRAAVLTTATADGKLEGGGRAEDAESVQLAICANAMNDGNWHHIAVVTNVATDSVLVYIDGALVATTGTINFTATSISNTNPVNASIGGNVSGVYWTGSLAGIRLYDSILTQTDVRTIIVNDLNLGGSGGGLLLNAGMNGGMAA